MRAPPAFLLTNPQAAARGNASGSRHRASGADLRGPADPWIQPPPVSIHLLMTDARGEVLLGLRNYRPARDSWFVPGGGVRTDERVGDALRRIAREELDLDLVLTDAAFLDVYEHQRGQEFMNGSGYDPRYIAVLYQIQRDLPQTHRLPRIQHRDYRWMKPSALLAAPDVHPHVKQYFRRDAATGRQLGNRTSPTPLNQPETT
jgi:colanic acid biosynthesis protein WcaH